MKKIYGLIISVILIMFGTHSYGSRTEIASMQQSQIIIVKWFI